MAKYGYLLKTEYMLGENKAHLTIRNVFNSGRLISIEKVIINCAVVTEIGATPPLYGVRTTTLVGGSNEILENYGLFSTYAPEPKALIKIGRHTATEEGKMFAIPGWSSGLRSGNMQGFQYEFFNKDSHMILQEEEGLSIVEEATENTDNYFNVMIYWDEIIGMKRYKEEEKKKKYASIFSS